MRVIAGEFRSRVIRSLPGMEMRPTPDKMRETLFDILGPRVAGSTFLDAYAGTGAVGIEALSRGATSVVFLETHKNAVRLIGENLKSMGLLGRGRVIAGPALRELGKRRADIVFLDPPYPLEKEYGPALEAIGRMGPRLAIAQHSVRFDPGETCGVLVRYRVVRQGDTALSWYRVGDALGGE